MKNLENIGSAIDRILLPIIVFAIGFGVVISLNSPQEPSSDPWFQRNVATRTSPVLVKFGADWCGPCRQMDKTLAKYRREPNSVIVHQVDVDERRELASHYRVNGIPKLILFKNGEVVAQQTGSMPLGQLTEWIDSNR